MIGYGVDDGGGSTAVVPAMLMLKCMMSMSHLHVIWV